MKKVYETPEIEVMNVVESTDLLTMSLYTDEVESKDILIRETEMFFDDEEYS